MDTSPTPADALKRACDKVGSQTALARALNRTKAAVSRWLKDGVPAEVCPDIEELTSVRCEELRPDVNWSVLRQKPRKTKAA
jgi:DNA-binding transcriptional regulator YdaS (Cro superfamily)